MVTRDEAQARERFVPSPSPDAPATSIVVNLDACEDHADAIGALALTEFLAGRQPYSRAVRLQRVRPDGRLLPDGVEPTLVAEAKPNAGQSLARLLNLTDGLLG
ncbi:MAG: DUF5925 domain-containing protein [Acidimicrobiales bacterium]